VVTGGRSNPSPPTAHTSSSATAHAPHSGSTVAQPSTVHAVASSSPVRRRIAPRSPTATRIVGPPWIQLSFGVSVGNARVDHAPASRTSIVPTDSPPSPCCPPTA